MTWVIVIFAFVFVLGPLANAYAKRMERSLPPEAKKALADVETLRREVDQLNERLERLQEEQSFMVRLLSEGERARLESGRGTSGADGE